MPKIIILHLTANLSMRSGIMSVLMNYYRYLNADVQFDFIYFEESKDDYYSKEILEKGGHIFRISVPSLKKCFQNELKSFFAEHQNEYIALHIHEVYLAFLFAPIAKQYGIKNIITHSHATAFSDKKLSAMRNRILCLPITKISNHFFACSKDAGKTLYGKRAVQKGEITIINNAIDSEKFKYNEITRNNIRKELGLKNNFVVGHVGRFNKQKNHEFLVNIFYEIKKSKNGTKLILVGEGPLRDRIIQKVQQLGLGNDVLFLGQRNDVHKLLQAMDVFVLPSYFEGLPVIGVEVQASGLPIVMSSNITKEVGLTNYSYLQLSESADYWARHILQTNCHISRAESFKVITAKGFNICEEAKKLQNLYIEMAD